MNKIAFLDRDGVLNVDTGYLHDYADLVWTPGAREAVALLCRRGYTVLVVTNQSGIARGYYAEADMYALHDAMNAELERFGGRVAHWYFCPHYAKGVVPQYAVECDCRKPKPGLVLQGLRDYAADGAQCFLIGDGQRDVDCAAAAGLRGYLFPKRAPYDNLLTFVQDVVLPAEEQALAAMEKAEVRPE